MIIECENCGANYNNQTVELCPACTPNEKKFREINKNRDKFSMSIRQDRLNEQDEKHKQVRSFQTNIIKKPGKGMKIK